MGTDPIFRKRTLFPNEKNRVCPYLELLEADRRVALDLLEERDFPGEIVARVLLESGLVVVGLVPDVVAYGGGALAAGFPRALPCGVAAIEHAHLRLRPQRRHLGRGEVREHAVLGGKDEHACIAHLLARLLQSRAHRPPRAGKMAMV